MLTPREQELLSLYKVELGSAPDWRVHPDFPAIGPFDEHVVHSYKDLNRRKTKAILAGVRLALAGLVRLNKQVLESGYPWSYVIAATIEDTWLLNAETPPQLLFLSGRDSVRIENLLDCDFGGARSFRIRSNDLGLPPKVQAVAGSTYWTVSEPVDCEYRFFTNVYMPNTWVNNYLKTASPRFSREYELITRRILRFLSRGD